MEKQFASEQPKDGEHVLHCGHINNPVHHFFRMMGTGVVFVRPDGTSDEVNNPWLIVCSNCLKANPNPTTCIRGDSTWVGDDPIVEADKEAVN